MAIVKSHWFISLWGLYPFVRNFWQYMAWLGRIFFSLCVTNYRIAPNFHDSKFLWNCLQSHKCYSFCDKNFMIITFLLHHATPTVDVVTPPTILTCGIWLAEDRKCKKKLDKRIHLGIPVLHQKLSRILIHLDTLHRRDNFMFSGDF